MVPEETEDPAVKKIRAVGGNIEVSSPRITTDADGFLTISYPIVSSIFPDNLSFKIDTKYEGFIDESLNCALTALILPAMRSGFGLVLNGNVSERLLSSCQGSLQSIIKLVLDYSPVPVVFNGSFTDNVRKKESFVVTGFSGGIDSYSILKDHYFQPGNHCNNINALVFNNVGANGTSDERDLFESRLRHAREGASAVGLPLIVIESNMDDFYSVYDDLHFFKTHSFRNSAVAHLLSNAVSGYLYAAASVYSEVRVEPSNTLGYVDLITLPLLSSEYLHLQSEGAQYSRSDKIAAVADLEVVQNNLHVCVDHNIDGNCSQCQKCVRTLLVIDFLGRLEKFSNVFDLDTYFSVKDRRFIRLISKNDNVGRDIKLFAERNGVKFSASLLIRLKFSILYRNIRKRLKSLLRTVSGK